MTYEQWIETYKPMHNHIAETSDFDDTMFETYGDECQFIQELVNTAPDTIWTLVAGDSIDGWSIISGRHYVNRMGYFVSQVPFAYDMEIQIT